MYIRNKINTLISNLQKYYLRGKILKKNLYHLLVISKIKSFYAVIRLKIHHKDSKKR